MAYFDKYGIEFSDDRKILVHCPEDFEWDYAIPDGVVKISRCAFSGCTRLTQVSIPKSVTHIDDLAFLNCHKLSSVNIPDSVSYIGNGAFAHCRYLSDIIIPDNTELGDFVFDGSGISAPFYTPSRFIHMPNFYHGEYEIPAGIKSIAGGAFFNCESLSNLIIPDSVVEIGNFAVRNCNNIQTPIFNKHVFVYLPRNYEGEYIIPEGIEMIAGGAFSNCGKLTNVVIPESVFKIGKFAFKDCNLISKPIFNKHVFGYLPPSYQGEYDIQRGIEMIAGGAFYSCARLTNVSIPDSIKYIGDSAFNKCSRLKSVKVPSGVDYISPTAFDIH